MWPFGKKEECFACRKQVSVAAMLPRRGQRFCSQDCVARFVNENPFPRPRGDDAQLAAELGNLITAITGEVARLDRASGLQTEEGAHEERMDARARFLSLATETLPYLQALRMNAAFDAVDTLDVEGVIDGRVGVHGAFAALRARQ